MYKRQLLGLTALVIPVIIIVRYKKTGNRNQPVLYGASMCACALSLFFQICYSDHLVKIKDWSALSDTSEAVGSGALNQMCIRDRLEPGLCHGGGKSYD